jgi:hypothetical protein
MKPVGAACLFGGSALIVWSCFQPQPWPRMLLMISGLLLALKAMGMREVRFGRGDSQSMFAFLFLWPGVSPLPFLKARARYLWTGSELREIAVGFGWFFSGVGLFFLIQSLPSAWEHLSAWLGILSLLMIFHLGFWGLWSLVLRRCGWSCRPICDAPWRSRSLQEFWSRRWNLPFIEMNQILFVPAFRRFIPLRGAIFGAFFLSGIFHELSISHPAAAGWGLPTAYFVIQGMLVAVEKRFVRIQHFPNWARSTWVWCALLLPLPLLFHRTFRDKVILPLFNL